MLLKFLYHFVPTIIGSEKWKQTRCSVNISELLTVSNEVFLYFTVENNYNHWLNNYVSDTTKVMFANDDTLTLNAVDR